MNDVTADELHRTLKLEVDAGRAATFAEAKAITSTYVLQIVTGAGMESPTRQAMLLTAVNTGRRAFLGGVRVRVEQEIEMTSPWALGLTLSQAVEEYGGELSDEVVEEVPTLVIGDAGRPTGGIVLYPTWDGWTGGVVESDRERLPERAEFALAGVLAGSFGVSEAFQHIRGDPLGARRSIGLSLWRPELD